MSLSICGEVERPARLALAELRALIDAEMTADFHCREGWSRLDERWRGVRLRTLLALAGASEAAGYVTRQPQQATAETIALARLASALGSAPGEEISGAFGRGEARGRQFIPEHVLRFAPASSEDRLRRSFGTYQLSWNRS